MKGLFALLALLMAAQGPPREPQQPAPTFTSGVDVVRLDVSVVDRNGAPVRGLMAADFIVTDQGIRQEVQSVAVDQLPLSVQLVLDVSESVSGRRLKRLIAAANGLLTALRPGDRAGLVTFSHMLLVPIEMTADLAAVRAALTEAGVEVEEASVAQRPKTLVPLDEDGATKVLRLIDALEDQDDVDAVHANFDVDAEILERVAG